MGGGGREGQSIPKRLVGTQAYKIYDAIQLRLTVCLY